MMSRVSRRDGPSEIAEIDLKVACSMESNMCGNTLDNQGFLGSAGATGHAKSLKMSIKLMEFPG